MSLRTTIVQKKKKKSLCEQLHSLHKSVWELGEIDGKEEIESYIFLASPISRENGQPFLCPSLSLSVACSCIEQLLQEKEKHDRHQPIAQKNAIYNISMGKVKHRCGQGLLWWLKMNITRPSYEFFLYIWT